MIWRVTMALRAGTGFSDLEGWREVYSVLDDALHRLTLDRADWPLVTIASVCACNITMTLEAATAGEVFIRAVAVLSRASGIARMPQWPVIAVEIVTALPA